MVDPAPHAKPVYTREQVLAVTAPGNSDHLDIHFQPIVDLHDGLVVAYEALARPAPNLGFNGPGDMFEAAKAHNLLWELETVTRRCALEAAANWPPFTRLFINCTPAVFADPRFSGQLILDLATAPDLRPDRIVLEITELSDDQHIHGLTEQVRAAAAAGFNIALDDAGAGASGLNRMMTLRPHWVKLDREFVRGIDTDQLRQNLVRFFVHFARLSGVSVVAEGLESATELQTVTSLGVRYAQGFYLGRPGTRAQTLDPRFVSDVRTRWAAVEASVPEEMLEPTLGAICKPGEASACAASLPATLTIHEAVTALCARTDERMPDPVLVVSGGRPIGVVRLRDLFRLATTDGRLAAAGRTRLTGLPTRVRADQHLALIIQQLADSSISSADPRRASLHSDAAFIDLRAFADFSTRRGSEQADRLIRDLAELISAVVLSSVHDGFVAHIGDDRFIITAGPDALAPRLHALAAAFEQFRNDRPTGEVPMPTLRVLFLPGVLTTARHPRDIYRAEQRLREQARDRDSRQKTPGSYVLSTGDLGGRRLAA